VRIELILQRACFPRVIGESVPITFSDHAG
jgi:hypothetical protein